MAHEDGSLEQWEKDALEKDPAYMARIHREEGARQEREGWMQLAKIIGLILFALVMLWMMTRPPNPDATCVPDAQDFTNGCN